MCDEKRGAFFFLASRRPLSPSPLHAPPFAASDPWAILVCEHVPFICCVCDSVRSWPGWARAGSGATASMAFRWTRLCPPPPPPSACSRCGTHARVCVAHCRCNLVVHLLVCLCICFARGCPAPESSLCFLPFCCSEGMIAGCTLMSLLFLAHAAAASPPLLPLVSLQSLLMSRLPTRRIIRMLAATSLSVLWVR